MERVRWYEVFNAVGTVLILVCLIRILCGVWWPILGNTIRDMGW